MRHRILIGSLMLALSTAASAGQIYKWVDAKGVTHFGAQPPQGQDVTTINTSVPAPRPAAPTPEPFADDSQDAEQEAINEKVKADVAAQEAERKRFCQEARTSLAQLENNPRLRVEEDGEIRRIDEDERQQKIADVKKSIGEHCR